MQFNDRGGAECWAKFLLACICVCCGALLTWGDEPSTPQEITSFNAFYTLPAEKALKGTPFRIKGVVLCYDQGWNQLYINDGTRTAWVTPQYFQTNLEVGLEVQITGVSTFAQGPVMTNMHLQVLGHGAVPTPKYLEIPQLGSNFGEWIETMGWVRITDTSPGRLSLVVQDKGQTCLVYVMGLIPTNDCKSLHDCKVRLRGINASKTINGQLKPASVFVSGLVGISIVERPATKISESPVVSIDALLSRKLDSWTNNPVHLNGRIISFKPGESMVVKDATGSIGARIIQTTLAQLDEHVNLWGYLTISQGEIYLRDAYFEGQPSTKAFPQPANSPDAKSIAARGEITQISEISKMSPEEASEGLRVRIQGVVTFADPDWRNCFVQNQQGAVFVDLNQKDVTSGQWVEVTGETGAGGFVPEVIKSDIRPLGTTNLPAPVKADLEDLANGHLDSHWVQLEGVIRRTSEQWGHTALTLTTPKGRFRAVVPRPNGQPMPTNLIDALVSIRGACSSEINARGQMVGITLHVPGLDQITVLEPVPADPFSIRTTAINSVATFDPSRLAGRRVKVSGKVTHIIPAKGFYIQDASGGILIDYIQPNDLHVGDAVDVLGFPSMSDFSPFLEETTFVKTGAGSPPKPSPATAEEILVQGKHDGTLVKIEAHLVQPVLKSAHPKLMLQSGSIIFSATLSTQSDASEISACRVGSLLRLSGVCSIQGGETHEPESFRLLISKPQDIVLLTSPPWWTVQHTLILAGSLGLGILLALWWNISLRRQVQTQTEVIRRNQEELIAVSRQAGMAEVATSVLHNVGNVLNSINVSATLAAEELKESKTSDVGLVADLMEEHAADLGHFLTQDARGRQLPGYLTQLGHHLVKEKQSILNELGSLSNNIAHVKEIVSTQQSYAKVGGVTEKTKVTALIEDALEMNAGALKRHIINICREYGPNQSLEIVVDKHKVLQILINLISNAKSACAESGRSEKRITIRLIAAEKQIKISVSDNGAGILPENMARIFSYGFTTRKRGHGFGLHSAALAARDLGGSLLVQSEGRDKGATFTLELPRTTNQK